MENSIHPTAVIDHRATIGRHVSIGPFCVVEAGAIIGDGCRLASRVVIKECTTLGERNEVDEGTVLGGRPQHVARHAEWGKLVVGAGNMIRENVTMHRAMSPDKSTIVGDDNLIMVNAHIAHDCQVGNHIILTNNVMLAGHVTVEDYAYLSGGVGVHQFCRIGSHCMVGGQSHINKDVPPYVTVDGVSTRSRGTEPHRPQTPRLHGRRYSATQAGLPHHLPARSDVGTGPGATSHVLCVRTGGQLPCVSPSWPARFCHGTAYARRGYGSPSAAQDRARISVNHGHATQGRLSKPERPTCPRVHASSFPGRGPIWRTDFPSPSCLLPRPRRSRCSGNRLGGLGSPPYRRSVRQVSGKDFPSPSLPRTQPSMRERKGEQMYRPAPPDCVRFGLALSRSSRRPGPQPAARSARGTASS